MTSAHRWQWLRSALKGLTPVLLGAAALTAVPRAARADICFQTPAVLPGLSGAPIWKTPGVVRADLNEPRWAAAPQTWFDSDPTGTDGRYRIMVDSAYTELSVSFQAPTDLSSPSSADKIYFAFTTDGITAGLAKGISISVNNSGGTDPADAVVIQEYAYNGATWNAPLTPPPSWLVAPSVWRNNVQHDAAWGINFKINLAGAGLSAAAPFKIFLGLHKEDEVNSALSVNLSSPSPTGALVPNTLFVADPNHWANAAAINAGCPDGIALDGTQISSDAIDTGLPAPNEVNTTSGAINHFFARPAIPAAIAVGLSSGEFLAKFHIANWGSIADPAAAWTPLPGDEPGGAGRWVRNGDAPALNPSVLGLTCSANTATTTCGIPTPTEAHQCMYVELKEAPVNTVAIKTATAFTNMWFKPLSNFSAPAEISVKGLKAKLFHDDKPRDVYVYVYPKNLPPHGNEPIYLPTDKMAATRRFAETPPPIYGRVNNQVAGVDAKPPANLATPAILARPAPRKPAVVPAAAKTGGAGNPQVPLRPLPLPTTGIGDLDLDPRQALGAVWPSYDVHVYYDSGKTITINGKTTKQLVPMFPFTSFHSHEGPLYGFSHSFKLEGGAELQELRPDVFLLHIPSEGVAHVVTSITAIETPKGHGPPGGCPKGPPPVEFNGHCGCRVPGQTSGGRAPLTLLAAGALGLAFARRSRSRRG